MAVAHLVGSAYSRSNANYVTVTDEDNMYDPVSDTSDYATLRGRAGRSSNSTYYAFIHGFDFTQIPSNATVSGFKVLIKAYRSQYMATGNTNYRIKLASRPSNSYTIGNTTLSVDLATTVDTYEIPTGSLTWQTLSNYGTNFSIDIPLRNSSTSNTNYPYIYVYGAEIEVTYTLPNPRTVTTTLSGSGTIDPSGTNTYYDGDDFELTITPTNAADTVTATLNGSDITSDLVYEGPGEHSDSNVLGAYSLVSGTFNGSGGTYFQGIVGHGYDTGTTTTSNYYSSSNGTNVVFHYNVGFTGIPENATITNLYMRANGHAESTSQSSEYMCVQLKSGSSTFTAQYNFKSAGTTSNSTQTINYTSLPTIAQLENLVVECTLGYYGGAINGVTVYLEYEINNTCYIYSTTVSGNMTIAVTIGGGGSTATIYYKVNGTWVAAAAVYKKVNGSWVQQTDLSTVFDSSTNYVKG